MIKIHKILSIFLIIALISNNSFGAYLLKEGEPSPVQGVLLPTDEAKKIQIELMELDFCKQDQKELNKVVLLQRESLSKNKDIIQQLEIQKNQLNQDLNNSNKNNSIQNGLFFILGVITTLGIIHASK